MATTQQFTAEMFPQLREELNEAVKTVAKKHGLNIRFGNARYEALTATFQVNLEFAAQEGFDPARELWNAHCKAIGLEKEDFGKEFCFLGETERYAISGYNSKGRTNSVVIRRLKDGKEFITSPASINMALGRSFKKEAPPSPQAAADQGSDADAKAKKD